MHYLFHIVFVFIFYLLYKYLDLHTIDIFENSAVLLIVYNLLIYSNNLKQK
jgi:hypothetical protein